MMLLKISVLLFYIPVWPVFGMDGPAEDGLWAGLARECKDAPTVSCFQRNIYKYFDDTFQSKDVDIGGIVRFTKNNLKYEPEEDNETEPETHGRSSPFEEVSDALREKAIKFIYTHDLQLTLPEFLLQGGVLKISPRALDSIKLDLDPKQQIANGMAQPRIFFKKIKKFFSGRLVMALLAVLLVIKLIAMKLMFFLPTIMGVAAAKKLLLKVLLFVFPVLSHLFKLCPYYKPTKYHHHHHQISHLHHVGPHGHEHGPPGHHIPYLEGAHGIELDHPPPGWPNHHDDDLGYYSDGPSFTADFINHRKNLDLAKPPRREEDPLTYKPGGQGQVAVGHRGQEIKPGTKTKGGPLTAAEIENMVLKAEKEAILKAKLQEEQQRVEAENKRLQESIKTALKLQGKLKIQSMVAKQTSKIAAAYQPNLMPPPIIQPQIVHAVPAGSYQAQAYVPPAQMIQPLQHTQALYQHSRVDVTPGSMYYTTMRPPSTSPTVSTPPPRDPFYSPILDKIDNILVELRFHDEPCRERLICSMYKNPTMFSPHSNLISAELSRDASELQKPTTSNPSVIRFYKYVQAARDGQDKRDCLRLYPSCSIITE